MEKKIVGMVGVVFGICLFLANMACASYKIVSDYDIILDSPVRVIRYDTNSDDIKVTVVKKVNGLIQPNVTVIGFYTEPKEGVLDYRFLWRQTDQQGIATFAIPGPVVSTFRQVGFYVWNNGNSQRTDRCGNPVFDEFANFTSLLIWYANTDLPVRVELVHPEGKICVCPSANLILIYKVTNGWGTPLPGVEVIPVLGQELISTCPLSVETDTNGEAVFYLFAGEAEGDYIFQVKMGDEMGFVQSIPVSIRVGYECGQPGFTTATSISAVNPISYEGSMPIWKSPIGGGIQMAFLISNEKGQPVAGEEVTVAYPHGEYVTDITGKVTVAVSSVGWSSGDWTGSSIWINADSNVSLDFQIQYY